MNINSYNVSEIGYHYIGLRALAGLPSGASRDDQTSAISRSIQKYVIDKALRLMLPEPRGTFETVGEKVCLELVHFQFAASGRGTYQLTDQGRNVLELLGSRKYTELRRIMVTVHLKTYDNLRTVVQKHMQMGAIWRPIVDAGRIGNVDYIRSLLEPTFKERATEVATDVLGNLEVHTPTRLENALHYRVLQKALPELRIGVPLFRSLCDRLVSLRLLNIMRAAVGKSEFAKSYSPCIAASPTRSWYVALNIPLESGESFTIYLCEPVMEDAKTRAELLEAIYEAFSALTAQAGYYDISALRDFVCERLKIPEASFDEGVNRILDLQPCPLTTGLQYEGISARRKPLVRDRGPAQIYNLIRRV